MHGSGQPKLAPQRLHSRPPLSPRQRRKGLRPYLTLPAGVVGSAFARRPPDREPIVERFQRLRQGAERPARSGR
jgi:hypothetical protein